MTSKICGIGYTCRLLDSVLKKVLIFILAAVKNLDSKRGHSGVFGVEGQKGS